MCFCLVMPAYFIPSNLPSLPASKSNSNLFRTFPIRQLRPALGLVMSLSSDSKCPELLSSEHLRLRETLHWNAIRRSFRSDVLIEVKYEVPVEGPSEVLVEALWNWLDRRGPALNRRLAHQSLIEGFQTPNRRPFPDANRKALCSSSKKFLFP